MTDKIENNNEANSKLIEEFEKALLSLNRVTLKKLMDSASFESPILFIEKIIVPVMERIGLGWEQNRLALSQIYMSGRICEELVDKILPPGASERIDQPNMAICVLEDHHFLGKRIVYSLLRASGFELKDYGGLTVDEVVERVKNDNIRVLFISVLMLPSALLVKQLKEKLAALNIDVKIIVGGAPFTFDPNLWKEVKADFVGHNAFDAVNIINEIMEEVS
ncbi:MAG: cobalamin-dependent protein [Desulfobacterales bacterium]